MDLNNDDAPNPLHNPVFPSGLPPVTEFKQPATLADIIKGKAVGPQEVCEMLDASIVKATNSAAYLSSTGGHGLAMSIINNVISDLKEIKKTIES